MPKDSRPPLKYDWVDDQRRSELVSRVFKGEKIIDVAKDLDINYGNAKCIMVAERKKCRRGPGSFRKRRSPRLQRMFVVEKIRRMATGTR